MDKDVGGDFFVFNVERNGRFSSRADEKGIDEMNVALGLEKGGENGAQVVGAVGQLDDEEIALAECDGVFLEDKLGLVGIIDDDSGDGRVGGVEDGEGDNMDVVRGEQRDDIEQSPRFVRHEDGELLDPVSGETFGYVHVY